MAGMAISSSSKAAAEEHNGAEEEEDNGVKEEEDNGVKEEEDNGAEEEEDNGAEEEEDNGAGEEEDNGAEEADGADGTGETGAVRASGAVKRRIGDEVGGFGMVATSTGAAAGPITTSVTRRGVTTIIKQDPPEILGALVSRVLAAGCGYRLAAGRSRNATPYWAWTTHSVANRGDRPGTPGFPGSQVATPDPPTAA
jgi:hypothetical protein